jgi:hypothetical protein
MKIKSIIIVFFSLISMNLIPNNIITKYNDNNDTTYYKIGEFRVEKIKKIRHAYIIYLTNSTRDFYYTAISPKYKIKTDYEKLKKGNTYIMQLIYNEPKIKNILNLSDTPPPQIFKVNNKIIYISSDNQKGELVISPNIINLRYREDNFFDDEFFKNLMNQTKITKNEY